jgi:hypothetical protein
MIPSFPPPGGAPSTASLPVAPAAVSSALLDARIGTILNARVGPDIDGAPRWLAVAGSLVPLAPGAGLAAGKEVRVLVAAREPVLLLAVLPGEGAREELQGGSRGETTGGASRALADAQLSGPGRALHQLVERILAAGRQVEARPASPLAAAGASSAAPLLASGEADAPSVAQALHRAISGSGLFYESHQAQWVAGGRTIESVRAEPQGRLPPLPPQSARALEPAPPARDPGAGAAAAAAAAYAAAETSAGVAAEEPVHPAAVALVAQQLALLDGRQIVWQGQLWPGTPARVEVEEDQAARAAGEEPAWTSRLHVELPRLGTVDATLSLTAAGVRVVVSAPAADSADRMQAALPGLGEQLRAAGLTVARVSVERDG